MYKEYEPNPLIVDRAVEIWRGWVSNPQYKNMEGLPDPQNLLASSLAKTIADNCKNDDIDKFCESLRKVLLNKNTITRNGYTFSRHAMCLDVDYHPCENLQIAIDESGIKRGMPWKTTMNLNENHLSYSYGYASPYIYNYPLKNGKWLETTLHGKDIHKIVDLIENGVIDLDLKKV